MVKIYDPLKENRPHTQINYLISGFGIDRHRILGGAQLSKNKAPNSFLTQVYGLKIVSELLTCEIQFFNKQDRGVGGSTYSHIQCFRILLCITYVVAPDNDFAGKERQEITVYAPRATKGPHFKHPNNSKFGNL